MLNMKTDYLINQYTLTENFFAGEEYTFVIKGVSHKDRNLEFGRMVGLAMLDMQKCLREWNNLCNLQSSCSYKWE